MGFAGSHVVPAVALQQAIATSVARAVNLNSIELLGTKTSFATAMVTSLLKSEHETSAIFNTSAVNLQKPSLIVSTLLCSRATGS